MKIINQAPILITFLLSMLSGCSRAQSLSDGTEKSVLIVYLSRTNNTRAIAQIIQQQVGGRLVSLELVRPYPENYQTIVQQVVRENASGFLPPLKTRIDSIRKYDLIFIGFPTWGMQLPPPIKSFLKQYDLKGKIIIQFNTNAGYGIGSSFETVKDLTPGSILLEGFSTTGGIERDGVLFVIQGTKETQAKQEVKAWLKKIKIIQ